MISKVYQTLKIFSGIFTLCLSTHYGLLLYLDTLLQPHIAILPLIKPFVILCIILCIQLYLIIMVIQGCYTFQTNSTRITTPWIILKQKGIHIVNSQLYYQGKLLCGIALGVLPGIYLSMRYLMVPVILILEKNQRNVFELSSHIFKINKTKCGSIQCIFLLITGICCYFGYTENVFLGYALWSINFMWYLMKLSSLYVDYLNTQHHENKHKLSNTPAPTLTHAILLHVMALFLYICWGSLTLLMIEKIY